ncbi:MAG TPA: hypothetical protein PLD02_04855 [Saprospiraceae bacterium]|nr:hypothetical protein [Saprospiraceae bacterium]
MTTIIIIIIIVAILYFFFFRTKTEENTIAVKDDTASENPIELSDVEIINEDEIFTDENGRYRWVKKSREIPRYTYIKAMLNGKYWGEIDEDFSNQFEHSKFFDFNIYEVTLKDAQYSKYPFEVKEDYNFPREKLPKLIHTILQNDGKEYEVNLHEPIFELDSIKFNRKLHQDEGKEVFGTIDAIVTGYVLDFVVEHYTEKEYPTPIGQPIPIPKFEEPTLTKTSTPTGNVEYKGNYKRTEYFYSDYKKTYWDNWKYTKPTNTSNNEGCFSTITGIIGVILGIAFLLMMLPQMAFILPFFLILFLLNLIPAKIYSWIFRILGILLLIGFIASLFHFFNRSASTYIPKPVVVENPQERKIETTPIIDTTNNIAKSDTLIKHFRVWKDYDGNQYEGYIWTKASDYSKAKYFKNNLDVRQNTPRAYDEIIYSLKENDKHNLGGVYQLFDSIRKKEQLSNIKFAELIVSFVQDIPYAIIVPDDCNPNLYDDKFIQEYLTSENAQCDGFEKFGINSPVEFMSNLYGDCDTRTLLLYTMLAHYGYDVALFSSEYYSHSIIGVNLPISGIAYKYENQRYVLWETTAPNIKAGVLPKEISNLNYWRISLKSK